MVVVAWYKEVIVDEEELMTIWETRERVRPAGKCWSGGPSLVELGIRSAF